MKIKQQKPFNYRLMLIGVQVCPESTNNQIRALGQCLALTIEYRIAIILNIIPANLSVEMVGIRELPRELKPQIPIGHQITQPLAQSPAVSSLRAYTTPAR